MTIQVRDVVSDTDFEVAGRISDRAFGINYDAEYEAELLPLRRHGLFVIADDEGEPAGSGGSIPLELSLPGGASEPAWGVTAIGVDPMHRRKGILGAIMARLLDAGSAADSVAAVLYASESAIYGRFGFAPVSPMFNVHIDPRRSAFRAGWPRSAGRVRTLDIGPYTDDDRRRSLTAKVRSAFEACWRARPGETRRTPQNWDLFFGPKGYRGGKDKRLYLLHETDGQPDGYAIHSVDESWRATGPEHRMNVEELVAADAAVELELWRALLDHDLVRLVTGRVPVDWVGQDALADSSAATFKTNGYVLWARILDVPRALAARRYRTPGELVLRVDDISRPEAGGTFRLEVAGDGSAVCAPTRVAADLTLSGADLSGAWLGHSPLSRWTRAGRVTEHTAGAAARAEAMLTWDPGPFTTMHF